MADFNPVAHILIDKVLKDHPDWTPYIVRVEPEDDPEAEAGSVSFVIPAPLEANHQLQILQRGNTIEVAYDCGVRGQRAEAQFVFSDAEGAKAVADGLTFVRAICAGEVVVVRERLGRVARAIRRDGVSELAWFRRADEAAAAKPGRYVAIHRWTESQ